MGVGTGFQGVESRGRPIAGISVAAVSGVVPHLCGLNEKLWGRRAAPVHSFGACERSGITTLVVIIMFYSTFIQIIPLNHHKIH